MSGGYTSEDGYYCLPPGGLGVPLGGMTDGDQKFSGIKSFDYLTASKIYATRITSNPLDFPMSTVVSNANATISALDVFRVHTLILTNAGAITLNSFFLDSEFDDYARTVYIRFTAATSLTIKFNTLAGGRPFWTPNGVDYVLPAASKNRVITAIYCPVVRAFFVS